VRNTFMCPFAPLDPKKVDSGRCWKEQLTVLQLFHSELELLVQSGFIYVPLLFDPDVAREIQHRSDPEGLSGEWASGGSKPVVELEGRQFIASVNIQSVLANYERIDKEGYDQLKRDYLKKSPGFWDLPSILPTEKLQTIILRIMPYYIRKGRGLERRPLSDEDLLDLVRSKLDIPPGFIEQVDRVLDSKPLLKRLNDLDKLGQTIELPPDGPITGEALRQWLRKALESQIVNRERCGIEQELREREQISESKRNHIATLLYIEEKGSFELDGFGFSRIGSRDDYLIYKHTGEYILKDYYARSYRFPDCRVAVSTRGALRPLVVESYKHPFLIGHAPGQEICISGYNWPQEFTASNIIRLLEEGINALLYGYDARRRNGYHSLDPTLYYVKTIEFIDYRVQRDDRPVASV
jgi:hypothetical protein